MVLHIEGQSTRHRCSERESEGKIIVLFLVLIMKKEANKMLIVFMVRMRIVIYVYTIGKTLRKLEIENLAK